MDTGTLLSPAFEVEFNPVKSRAVSGRAWLCSASLGTAAPLLSHTVTMGVSTPGPGCGCPCPFRCPLPAVEMAPCPSWVCGSPCQRLRGSGGFSPGPACVPPRSGQLCGPSGGDTGSPGAGSLPAPTGLCTTRWLWHRGSRGHCCSCSLQCLWGEKHPSRIWDHQGGGTPNCPHLLVLGHEPPRGWTLGPVPGWAHSRVPGCPSDTRSLLTQGGRLFTTWRNKSIFWRTCWPGKRLLAPTRCGMVSPGVSACSLVPTALCSGARNPLAARPCTPGWFALWSCTDVLCSQLCLLP